MPTTLTRTTAVSTVRRASLGNNSDRSLVTCTHTTAYPQLFTSRTTIMRTKLSSCLYVALIAVLESTHRTAYLQLPTSKRTDLVLDFTETRSLTKRMASQSAGSRSLWCRCRPCTVSNEQPAAWQLHPTVREHQQYYKQRMDNAKRQCVRNENERCIECWMRQAREIEW